MENKELLLNILKLIQGIKAKEQTVIDENIKGLNALTATEEMENYMKDYLKNASEDKETLLYVIENLNLIQNKDFLKLYVEIRNDSNLTKEKLVEYLNTQLTINDEYDKYMLYSTITRQVINFGDPELIKTAIDKIQNL